VLGKVDHFRQTGFIDEDLLGANVGLQNFGDQFNRPIALSAAIRNHSSLADPVARGWRRYQVQAGRRDPVRWCIWDKRFDCHRMMEKALQSRTLPKVHGHSAGNYSQESRVSVVTLSTIAWAYGVRHLQSGKYGHLDSGCPRRSIRYAAALRVDRCLPAQLRERFSV